MPASIDIKPLVGMTEFQTSFRPDGIYTTLRVPDGVKLTEEQWRVIEYDAARSSLIYMCGEGSGLTPTDMLTSAAQRMVKDMGAIAQHYETDNPDVVEAWGRLANLRHELNIEPPKPQLYQNHRPVKIFTLE